MNKNLNSSSILLREIIIHIQVCMQNQNIMKDINSIYIITIPHNVIIAFILKNSSVRSKNI